MELASARERAAKAETEATFLRERLTEMRTERDELKEGAWTKPAATTAYGHVPPGRWWGRLVSRRRSNNR